MVFISLVEMLARAAVYNTKDSFAVGHRLPDVPPQLPHSSEGCLSQLELYIQLIAGLATHWAFFFLSILQEYWAWKIPKVTQIVRESDQH